MYSRADTNTPTEISGPVMSKPSTRGTSNTHTRSIIKWRKSQSREYNEVKFRCTDRNSDVTRVFCLPNRPSSLSSWLNAFTNRTPGTVSARIAVKPDHLRQHLRKTPWIRRPNQRSAQKTRGNGSSISRPSRQSVNKSTTPKPMSMASSVMQSIAP